jgi:hypothetical protein
MQLKRCREMRNYMKWLKRSLLMMAILAAMALVAGCDSSSSSSIGGGDGGGNGDNGDGDGDNDNDNDNDNGGNDDDDGPLTSLIYATYPSNGQTNIGANHKVTVTFTEAMDADTIDSLSFTVEGDNEPAMIGTITLDAASNTASFVPDSHFTDDTRYTATLTTAVQSEEGVPLEVDYVWEFTSCHFVDTEAPGVLRTDPSDGSSDIAIDKNISITFSESIDPVSVDADAFTVAPSADLAAFVEGVLSLNRTGTTVTFNPTNNLEPSTAYTATVTTGITDMAIPPVPLSNDQVWNFETGVSESLGPPPVALGAAGDFVILSQSGITNVSVSDITGNIGSAPITAASMDSVTCAEISGTIYGADDAYTGSGDTDCFQGDFSAITLVENAVFDMGIAYNDAADRETADFTELHAGDLSGQTLEPGLYKWGTGVLISTDMVFDGGPNDVWILQVSGDLTVENMAAMTLAGGAVSRNIFWQIGGPSGAIINSDAHVSGIVLAEKAITVATSASVDGRLLSQTEVTLQQNAVTEPAQ